MGCGASASRPSSAELSSYSGPLVMPQWDVEASRLDNAMKGFSVDDITIVGILARFRNGQRQKLLKVFKEIYDKDLIEVLSSELSGSKKEAILALLYKPVYYDAWSLHTAIKEEDWDTVTEIVVSRDGDIIEEIREVYLEEYALSLDDDLTKVEPLDLRKLLISFSKVDRQFARKKANKCIAIETAKRLHEDKDLVKLLCESMSRNQLRETFSAYTHLYKVDINGFINGNFSGWTNPGRDALKAYVACMDSSSVYFAKQMKKTVEASSVDETKLVRIAVSRSELDLYYIRKEFLSIYGKSLKKVIQKTCASDFAEVLTTIITLRGQYSESARRK